jgi:hypothetical protein
MKVCNCRFFFPQSLELFLQFLDVVEEMLCKYYRLWTFVFILSEQRNFQGLQKQKVIGELGCFICLVHSRNKNVYSVSAVVV